MKNRYYFLLSLQYRAKCNEDSCGLKMSREAQISRDREQGGLDHCVIVVHSFAFI